MNRITIEKAANGYIAREDYAHMPCETSGPPHVFETFDNMAAWLKEQLESKPQALGSKKASFY